MKQAAASSLAELVTLYYELRGYVVPTTNQAIMWHATEIGEALEILLARETFVRNNPQEKEPYSPARFGEELGDAIMMLIVAGLLEGVDPVACLIEKMGRKTGNGIFSTDGRIPSPGEHDGRDVPGPGSSGGQSGTGSQRE